MALEENFVDPVLIAAFRFVFDYFNDNPETPLRERMKDLIDYIPEAEKDTHEAKYVAAGIITTSKGRGSNKRIVTTQVCDGKQKICEKDFFLFFNYFFFLEFCRVCKERMNEFSCDITGPNGVDVFKVHTACKDGQINMDSVNIFNDTLVSLLSTIFFLDSWCGHILQSLQLSGAWNQNHNF